MTKVQRFSSIAAIGLFFTISLPGSVHSASIFGTWTDGFETTQTTNYLGGVPVSVSDSSGPATLGVGYMPQVELVISISNGGALDSNEFSATFGAQSGSGSLTYPSSPFGASTADFFGTYQSIEPNGELDTSVGTATANITIFDILGNANGQITIITFQTVPEPTSLVELASGILAVLVIARGRRFFSR